MKSHQLPSTAAVQVANWLLDEICADEATELLVSETDHFSQLRRYSTMYGYNSFGEVVPSGERLFWLTNEGNPISLLVDHLDFAIEHNIPVNNRFCAYPRASF